MRVVKALLVNCMQRHGAPGVGGTCMFVSENDDVIDGMIVGVLDRVYQLFDKLSAADLFFYVAPGGSPTSAGGLIDAFIEWAEGIDDVIEIRLGATDIIQDYQRVGALYRRKGFTQTGVIYERRTDV